MKIAIKIFIISCLFCTIVYSQNNEPTGSKFTISGYVKDKANGESAPGATILIKEINKATSANQYGFYSLTVPSGSYTVVFSFMGYETFTQSIQLNKNTSLNINLVPAGQDLSEVEISTDKPDQNVSSSQMSAVNLDNTSIYVRRALIINEEISFLIGPSTVNLDAITPIPPVA